MSSVIWRSGAGSALDLDAFRALDKERREFITANEQRKAQRNKASEEIARLKKEKQNADAIIAEMKQLSELIKQTDEKVTELDARQRELLLTIPNIPHSSVPAGTGAADNVGSAPLGHAAKVRFSAQAALGNWREDGNPRSGERHEDHRRAICSVQGLGGAAGTRDREFLPRCSHARTRLHRNPAAFPGEHRFSGGRRPIAEIRG